MEEQFADFLSDELLEFCSYDSHKNERHKRLEYCLRQENTLNGAFRSGKSGKVI